MTMQQVTGIKLINPDVFKQEYEPHDGDMLCRFDGPLTKVVRNSNGLFLFHWCDDDREAKRIRYLVAMTDSNIKWMIHKKAMSIRAALTLFPVMWIVEVDYDYEPVDAWEMKTTDISENYMPEYGLML